MHRYTHIVMLLVVGLFTQSLLGVSLRACCCDDHGEHAAVQADCHASSCCDDTPAPGPTDESPDRAPGGCECPLPCCADASKTTVATPGVAPAERERLRPSFGVMIVVEAVPHDGSSRLLRPPRTRALV